jgi:hypothetical protein
MFHSFTGNAKMFSSSVFADRVSQVLAEVLTGGDYLRVCTCLQGGQARGEMMRLCVRAVGRKCALSDILGEWDGFARPK